MFDMLSHIYSQVYKNICSLRKNTFRLADVLVWPMIFLFTLTFFANYLGSNSVYIHMIILGMMGWRVIYLLNIEIVSSFVEEHWSKSLPHLLTSPISRFELAVGGAASGLLKSIFVILIYLISTYYLYNFTITDWPIFLLALVSFALIGFSVGLVTLGLAYFWKSESFNLAFIWPDVLVLLSGVYFSVDAIYPASVLPIIRLLPSTQAFELLKSMVGLGNPDITLLVLLTALWVLGAYLFNGYMYERARKAGRLTRLG